ncbi:MAG TPA: glycosyl hydrolase family 3 [Selenomonas sp.]|jgi:beta-N-acetylhexosaminidase|nr:glycosyl hydrolase family 3 [Selenomonas sp.]
MGLILNWQKHKLLTAALAVVVGVSLGAVLYGASHLLRGHQAAQQTGSPAAGSGSQAERTIDEQVDQLMAGMKTTEKVGQLVMIGIHGTDVTEDSLYMLHQFHYGGVILFDRNLESQDQIRELTQHLQAQAEEKAPLFIAIDQEGGDVARGKGILEVPPSQLEVGRSGKPERAEELAQQTGTQLHDLGINVNFAPVTDVGSPDRRSFSKDPQQVKAFVQAAGRGYARAHEIYALKHFPGIGRGRVDSHQEISSIEASREQLQQSDLVPFQAMIQQDKGEGDFFVLVSHLRYPALDAEHPASQSKAIMTDLLRQQLGFQGIIITDDMEMGAVAKHGSYRDMGVKAILAGADMVMMCHEYQHEQDIYMGILDAVNDGTISEERLNASVRRILRAKLLHLQPQT